LSEGRRKLAAIMFTDIVGYTAITQLDESRALQLLKTHNGLLRPIFEKHNGKEIKTIGDAFLIEFESALDATLCAIEVQQVLHNYNDDPATTEDRKIRVRVGVHLGDVVHKDNDVFGDAVNIASRIQPLAGPDGICVSEQVFYQVRNKVSVELQKLDKVELKNVMFPIDVYRIILPWETVIPQAAKAPEASLKKRLAVLPLTSSGVSAEYEYFAEGMTEELITVLSNIKDLRVIARSSVFRYRGTTKSVGEIGRELNVGSVLEGNIRMMGSRVRVSVQMVDSSSEEHLWASSYDREMSDIFVVQGDIAKQVSKALKAKFRGSEKVRVAKKQTESMDAYSFYLKGRFALHKRNKQAMEEAIKYFEEAIVMDSKYARAYAGLADCYLLMGSYGYSPTKDAYSTVKKYVSKALELDDNLPEAHVALGFLLEAYYYDFTGAREQFEHAISLSPSNSQARHWYAINLATANRLNEAIVELEKAQEADPLSPQISTVLGGFYSYVDRDDDALRTWENGLKSNPNNVPIYLNRGIYFAKVHRNEDAMADMLKGVELASNQMEIRCLLGYVYARLSQEDESLKILEEVRQKEISGQFVSPFYVAILYSGLGRLDESVAYLEKAIDDRSAEIESLLHDSMFEDARADPRVQELLRKIGVTLPQSPEIKS
jgi:adenylate cyclase